MGNERPAERSIRLGPFFVLSGAGLALLLGVLFWLVFSSSRAAVRHSAELLRGAAAGKVSRLVEQQLHQAEDAVALFERRIHFGVFDPTDRAALEAQLFAELLAHQELYELTLTFGVATGYANTEGSGRDEGDVLLSPAGRGQLSLLRLPGAGGEHLSTRWIHSDGGRFVSDLRDRGPGASVQSAPFARAPAPVEDPTTYPSFTTPANLRHRGRALWSDLFYAEVDRGLPRERQRKVVTVQKAIFAGDRFLGVLRAGLIADAIDRLGALRVDEADEEDAHRVFLTDTSGRLITRLSPADRYDTVDEDGTPDADGDVRVIPAHLPPMMAAALASPLLRDLGPGQSASGRLDAQPAPWAITFTALPAGRTRGWVIGVMVPESYYLRGLLVWRDRLLGAAALVMAGILIGGGLTLQALRRGIGRVTAETKRIHRFEFTRAEAQARSMFREVNTTLDSLEHAKTALRAMGKYVPVALVRQQFQQNTEPTLGGALTEVTLMFTDIASFTEVSEALPPNVLAAALGRYFQAMTFAVQNEAGGTVDKYIGDSLMVMWNAPLPCPGHPERACEAALRCLAAQRALYASPEWQGLPAWHTRFGLHRDKVTVGHFGAPDRLSFTAIGDGVNLASRLEGLNKQYGTTILASEAVVEAARARYVFRLLDRVAVKGKQRGVRVYELLGRLGEVEPEPHHRRYEAALAAYFARRFQDALSLLSEVDDEPGRRLAARCRHLAAAPPPADWDGVFVAKEK